MRVHNHLGPGLPEQAYEEALCVVLEHRGIPWERQAPIPIVIEGKTLSRAAFVDIVCFGDLPVELKAGPHVARNDARQLLRYMEWMGAGTGLVLAFGGNRLSWYRVQGDRPGAGTLPNPKPPGLASASPFPEGPHVASAPSAASGLSS